jgi:hypothetical protein
MKFVALTRRFDFKDVLKQIEITKFHQPTRANAEQYVDEIIDGNMSQSWLFTHSEWLKVKEMICKS